MREVDPRCPSDQETSSSSSKDAPSRIDAAKVITWLKPIDETQADAL